MDKFLIHCKARWALFSSQYGWLLLLVMLFTILAATPSEQVAAQSTPVTPSVKSSTPSDASPTVTPTTTAPIFLFSTPPPVRTEEPLTSGFRNVPAVFDGVETYHLIQAQLTTTGTQTALATTPLAAIGSVVQILRCDGFGCDTPVGSGTIIHPSGLILTAYHILLEDPNDLRSAEYQNFVIALAETPRSAPRPRYLASVVADKNEQDIALLAIDRDLDETPIPPDSLDLPALPFADVDLLFADMLHILGYPLDGGDAINYDPATFRSFDDNGQLIVVKEEFRRGNSGGPALVLQDGRLAIAGLVIRGRSTQGNLAQEGVLRAVDQVVDLNWANGVGRVMGRNGQIGVSVVDDEALLQLAIELSTFDLVNARLRLFFYAVDAVTGEPWQAPETPGPLVSWANIDPAQVVDAQQVQLTVPVADLGTTPEQLRFYALLWDRDNRQSLWASEEAIRVDASTLAVLTATPTASPTLTARPTTTNTPTSSPTNTPRPTTTPTLDEEAIAAALETAVKIFGSTPTSIHTPSKTATPTSHPTSTATVTAIDTPTPTETTTPSPQPTATLTPFTTDMATATTTLVSNAIGTPPRPTNTATMTATSTDTSIVDTATVLVRALRIRSGPSTEFDIVGAAVAGDRYTVTGQAFGCQWYQIAHPTIGVAWIAGSGLSVTDGDCASIPDASSSIKVTLNTPIPTPTPSKVATSIATNTVSSTPVPTDEIDDPFPADQGCLLLQNQLGAELTFTFTSADGNFSDTVIVSNNTDVPYCVAPGRYTVTVDAPPPWADINEEFTINAGDRFYFPIRPQ